MSRIFAAIVTRRSSKVWRVTSHPFTSSNHRATRIPRSTNDYRAIQTVLLQWSTALAYLYNIHFYRAENFDMWHVAIASSLVFVYDQRVHDLVCFQWISSRHGDSILSAMYLSRNFFHFLRWKHLSENVVGKWLRVYFLRNYRFW